MVSLVGFALFLLFQSPAPADRNAAELARTESLIEQLSEMKAKISALEGQIDSLLKALAEQKGALQNPKTYNALEHVGAAGGADEPDTKKAAIRCAALTTKGSRCTRPAADGSRYCSQHQLARQK